MRFLTDENIARSTVSFLRSLAHDVKDAKEQKWFGFPDEKLAQIAKRENRIILTLDKDFGNVLVFPPHLHQGILLVDVRNLNPARVNAVLVAFLVDKNQKFFKRKLVVLNDSHVRIRE